MEGGRRLVQWVLGWNVATWFAAALCLAPFAIMMFGNPTAASAAEGYSPPLWEILMRWLLLPIFIILFLPLVAAPQFVTFWLVRRAKRGVIQLLLLLVSAAMLVPYYRFVSTADLISTSTAPLAAAFYPIYLAVFAVPLSLGVYLIGNRMERACPPRS